MEIKLAQKREKDWRDQASKVIDDYRGKKQIKNSFNILWANTEVLRPALYNSTPKPDVRRRFRQEDKLGKAVSEVMERSVSYCVDAYDIDNCLQNDVLDALLPGRAVTRVRYQPKIKEVASATPDDASGTREEVEYEQAFCDHVQWDDFLHGPGRVWEEVPWEAFKHRLTKDDLIEKFGKEVADKITLNDADDDDLRDGKQEDLKEVFQRAEVWEIWDKDGKKVFFLNESYQAGLLYAKDATKGEPPLKLKNFFPNPRPLMLVEDTGSLVPLPLYELYRQQAAELNLVSLRINKIVNACRVRFIHDSTLTELKALMDAGDNEGIPTDQARAWLQNGGIEKAIWFMPIQQVAAVLKELYVARDAAKQVIYEITGISDIIRGATDPRETLGAQKLKANSSSLRLQRMQREVQRYTRDLIRLLAEVVGENFSPETLALMTGLQFPTNQQKQEVQLKMQPMQQAVQFAQQSQQQVPPEVQKGLDEAQKVLSMPSWEDIMGVLKSDMQREYKVDVETDSTVAQSLQQDLEGLREVYTGMIELWNGAGPAVAAGAVSIDVIKSLSLNLARRARMGLEVEDALETGLQQPKPQADPNAAKAEEAKVRAQADAQREQEITKREAQTAQTEQAAKQQQDQVDLQREQLASQEKVALDAQKQTAETERHRISEEQKYEFERWKVEQDNNTKVEVAKIGADAKADAQDNADLTDAGSGEAKATTKRRQRPIDRMEKMHGEGGERIEKILEVVTQLAKTAGAPKRVKRGADGRVESVETMQ